MTRTHEKAKAKGFTLVELAIVLVIIGIIISAAGLGWYSLMEGRKLAKTYGTMVQAKECLVKRMLYSNQYPSYTANLDCDTAGSFDLSAKDVDACICNLRDAWGQRLYYLEGVNGTVALNSPLTGFHVTDNPAQNQNATKHQEYSVIKDKDENHIRYVAFVLISSGKNLTLDNSSYRGLFTSPSHVATLSPTSPPNFPGAPDFSVFNGPFPTVGDAVRDDVILTITGPELMTLLTE